MYKVSVIVPVYNAEKYIKRCVDSVLQQSLDSIEIILVNDCGNDNAFSLANELYAKEENVVFIDGQQNEGPMKAREKGYKVAGGQYLFFLDSDDYLPENSLFVLYDKAIKCNSDIVVGSINRVDENGNQIRVLSSRLQYGNDMKGAYKSLLQEGLTHNLAGKLFKRDLFTSYTYDTFSGMVNGEDGYLFYLIVKNIKRIDTVDEIVYIYESNSNSTTHSTISDNIVDGYVKLQNLRYHVMLDYAPEQSKYFYQLLYEGIGNICYKKYSYRSIKEKLAEYGIEISMTPHNLLKYLSVRRTIYTILKTFLVKSV